MSTATKTRDKETEQKKSLTIAQRAGYARRKLKNRGITTMEDHRGDEVPINYVPDIDVLKHVEALEIVERARALHRELAVFKYRVQETGDDMYKQLMDENEIRDNSVGGFTMAAFDKSLKVIYAMDTVQVKIPEELKVAEKWWKEFIDEHYDSEDDQDQVLIEIVNELLHNTKDQIDMRNIGRLNRLGTKIKNKNFHKFLKHLNQAYDTEHTKRYEQFKVRNEQGQDESIVLTYQSIEPQNPDQNNEGE